MGAVNVATLSFVEETCSNVTYVGTTPMPPFTVLDTKIFEFITDNVHWDECISPLSVVELTVML